MIRSFLPVGQGAFYTEQFDCGVNVVYDCGSSTSRSAIEKQIACTFEPREKIQQFLFPIYTKITSTDFHFCYPTAVWNVCTFHS